jgi:integrase
MATREKLPPGLYRRRRRDGTPGGVLWCWFRPKGSKQPVKMSTGTADVEEAKRVLYTRLAEDPKARTERITTATITVADALALLKTDRAKRGTRTHEALYRGLRHAFGHLAVSDIRPIHLDDLCERWRQVGVAYPERDEKRNPQYPASGTTCNHGMRMLRQALRLAAVKLAVPLPPGLGDPLAYPRFPEPITGQYIPPETFYAILGHVEAGPKRALLELAYLTGVRKGQLRKTELRNVRVERGKVSALVWDAPKVKNRREHTIPLEGRAQVIVQELWEARRLGCRLLHLDGRPLGELRSEWQAACEKAGVPCGRKAGGYVMHDTRRCSLTNLAAANVPDVVARSISGHRTPSVHARYCITQENAKRAALAAADRLVEAGRST